MISKYFTSFTLKIVGIVLMVFDHVAQFFSFLNPPIWFHWLGRIVAPIFLFTSSEGFIYTRNKKKYLFRLWLGFVLMSIGNSLFATYFSVDNEIIINNIFGTLFLGVLYMQAIEWLREGVKRRQRNQFLKGIALFLFPILYSGLTLVLISSSTTDLGFTLFRISSFIFPSLIMVEGGVLFVLLAVLFYLFHGNKTWQILSLIAISVIALLTGSGNPFIENFQWMMGFAAIPIILYNGEKGKNMRNFFYIFYPAHIYLLALIAYFIRV